MLEEVGEGVSDWVAGDEVIGFVENRASQAELVVVPVDAIERGATVIGLASEAAYAWLSAHGVTPIPYGDGVEDRIRAAAPGGVDAFVDTYGPPYVEVALGIGVATGRINTIIDFAAVAEHGVLSEGNAEGANVRDLTEMATRIADGRLEMPIAATYPLDEVQDGYRELEQRHTRGKIVLLP